MNEATQRSPGKRNTFLFAKRNRTLSFSTEAFNRDNAEQPISPKTSDVKLRQPTKTFANQSANVPDCLRYYQRSLQHLLLAAGLESEQVTIALESLDKVLTEQQHQKIRQQIHLTTEAQQNLNQLQTETNTILANQEKIHAVIKIQSFMRGFYVRNWIKKFNMKDKEKLRMKAGKINQLLQLENEYLTKFQHISDTYLKGEKIEALDIPVGCYYYLSSNINHLLSIHQDLMKELQVIVSHPRYPYSAAIGQCFMRYIGRLAPAYSQYCYYYPAAVETLTYLYRISPKFQAYIDDAASSIKGINGQAHLKTLLEWPLLHVSSLDKKLVGVFNYTERTESDYEPLYNITTALGVASDLIRSQVNQQRLPANLQLVKQMLAVEWQIEGNEKPLRLLSWSKRKLLHEGKFKLLSQSNSKKTSTTTINIHLFNDVAIISEKLENQKNNNSGSLTQFKFLRLVGLHQISFSPENGASKDKERIHLLVEREEPLIFQCKNKTLRSEWHKHFHTLIEHYSTHKTFGVSLADVVQRESQNSNSLSSNSSNSLTTTTTTYSSRITLPRIFTTCCQWLTTHGKTTEGIFRVPGDNSTIIDLKRLYDSGLEKDIDFRTLSIHDIAGLFKLYLRELPEPVIPFSYYQTVVDLQNQLESRANSNTSTTTTTDTSAETANEASPIQTEFISEVATLLSTIPPLNLAVLHKLVVFLGDLALAREETKMDTANLAMVFAPNIVRPQVESVDTAMQNATVSNFIENLILCETQIWSNIQSSSNTSESPVTPELESIVNEIVSSGDKVNLSASLQKLSEHSPRPSKYINLAGIPKTSASGDVALRSTATPVKNKSGKTESMKVKRTKGRTSQGAILS